MISKRLFSPVNPGKTHRMWNAKTTSTSPIKIDKTIKDFLPLWETDPSAFFHRPQTQPNIENNPPAQIYLHLSQLQQTRTVDLVRWRLSLLVFYQLREDFNKKHVHAGVQDQFVKIIHQSGLTQETDDEIKQNCTTWAGFGGRYQVLVKELGGRGVLLLLPDDISGSM